MCLDIMVVIPENNTKEGIINVNTVDTHNSLLMLFNIYHQPSNPPAISEKGTLLYQECECYLTQIRSLLFF